jgi:hypothetical protein
MRDEIIIIFAFTIMKRRQTIKFLKYTFIVLVMQACIFYSMAALFLHIPYVQEKLATAIEIELSKCLNVPVKIGRIELILLNRLVVREISIEDRNGEVLFEADYAAAGIKLLPILQHKLVLTTVRLFGFSLQLKKEPPPKGELNLQFLRDAFSSSPDTTTNPSIELKFKSVHFRRGTVSYQVGNRTGRPDKFDPEHVEISNLNGRIELDVLNADSLNLHIRKLSFEEHAGFKLNKLSMDIAGNRDSLSVRNLNIRLPETQLYIPAAGIRTNGTDSLLPFADRASGEVRMIASRICLQDFAAFAPVFKNMTDRMTVSAKLSGKVNDLALDELVLSRNDAAWLRGNMKIKAITHSDQMFLDGQISRLTLTVEQLSDLVGRIREQNVVLPEPIARLGNLSFTGEVSGVLDHLVACGKLQSNIGSLEADLLFGRKKKEPSQGFYLKGRIASSEWRIDQLFGEGNPFGTARFDMTLDAAKPENGPATGTLRAQIYRLDYHTYPYENILIAGRFHDHEWDGSIEINNPNGKFYAEGLFRNEEQPAFNFSARLTGFRPDKLHLTHLYEEPEVSMSVTANFTGNHPNTFGGQLAVDHLLFRSRTDSFALDSLRICTTANGSERKLTLASDVLNGELWGAYSFSTLRDALLNTGRAYLPSFFPKEQPENDGELAFNLAMTVGNTESLSRALKLPFSNLDPGQVSGRYSHAERLIRIEALLPRFRIGKSICEAGSIHINNNNVEDKLRVQAQTTLRQKKGTRYSADLRADVFNDRIKALLSVENDLEQKMKVDFSTSTRFIPERKENGKQSLRTEITLEPSQVILRDSVWNMEPASITIMEGNTTIDNFYLSKGKQYLHVNGTVSARNPKEAIRIDLSGLELEYIFDLVHIPALQFGGKATGTISLNNLYGSLVMNTELEVQDFAFNQAVQGKLNLFSEWDDEQKGILLLGTIYKDDQTWTDLNGYIFPEGAKKGLSLYFDAKDLNLALLHPYVDAFTKTIEGRAFGNIHLFGPFSALNFEGKALVKDGRIGVDFLNTSYAFSDTIRLEPDLIRGKEIAIYDKNGNRGRIDFEVRHKYLKDFSFQVDFQTENLLIYDMPEKMNPQIYGTVYGSGNGQIRGNEQLVTIDANVRNDAKTSMGFNFMNGSTAEAYDFVLFRPPAKNPKQPLPYPTQTADGSGPDGDGDTELRVNCLVNVTPDASLELVMDMANGSKIRSNGNGDIRLHYEPGNTLSMYGGYTILNGSYNFNLEQLIRKDFQIREGSRIDFSGRPTEAMLDLSAIYFLTANIEDLDQALLKETVRTSVPVNCVLNLNGRLQNPAITFDLEFPNSTDELARQVKSFIDTEDMMTRQIIYLLVLSKFYTPDYSRNDYRSNEFSAAASSALSAQLSGILRSLTDKVQIGTNIRSRQDGVTDTEVEMLLSSQLLDNRLLFNGNFGYKNSFVHSSAFIGEFDLEYKLTPGGEYRLKAYNHANDMYRYNNLKSLTRQGVGIMFYKDFSAPSEIFKRRRNNKN